MITKKKSIFCIFYLTISYCLFYALIDYLPFLHFSIDLLIAFSIFDIFVSLHFVLNIKKMYNYLFDKRYFIGIFIFLFLVIGKYNGSSIEIWNGIIQPEYQLENSVILGKTRSIRSDEWLVSTPISLSQVTEQVNLSKYNNLLGATENLVTLNPKLPNTDILSLLSSPNNLGYLVMDSERGFSFSWYFCFFLLFFASLELFMILTNKNKIFSFLGAVLLTLSPVIQWWQSPQIVSYGNLAIVLFYNFIISKTRKKKILFSLLFGYSGLLYIMCLYPAWQVPYGYCYLILIIWIIIKNKDKIKVKDLLYLIPTLGIILIILVPLLISNKEVFNITSNTVYPGDRFSIGGGEWRTLFTYINSIYYPYKDLGNPCEFSQYFSLFPFPIIYGIYVMIKNKKKDLFIILSIIVILTLSLWIMFPLGTTFSKVTLLYMTTETRVQVAIGFLTTILLIYLLSNYETKKIDKNKVKYILLLTLSFISSFIVIKISNSVIQEYFPNYLNLKMSILSLSLLAILIFLMFLNNKVTNKILISLLIFISFVSGIIVSPINKGTSVFYNKPLSKEINEIISSDSDSIFLASDSGITLANYLVANGAKTINTTNYIPNIELYKKLDTEEKYNDVYNRYEHVAINLTDEDTTFILNQDDYITINLNYNDVCKIEADYLVTNSINEIYNNFELIYNEYGIKIFDTNCQ